MHVSLQLATLDKFIPAAANLYKIRVFHAQQPGSSLLTIRVTFNRLR